MTDTRELPKSIYLTVDCEFTESGLVREIALILFKNNQIVRVLEILISPSGNDDVTYQHQQINYHVRTPESINACINGFLDTCVVYAPLNSIRVVGMSLEHDLKSLLNTTKVKSKLHTLSQKTQLEMCGRGTLETKALNFKITKPQIHFVLAKIVSNKHKHLYRYHTALFDAVVTGYVYLRVMSNTSLMGLHPRFKKCQHTYFKGYFDDLAIATKQKKESAKPHPQRTDTEHVPKNFPEIRYRVQKNISNVFDVVAREMFYHTLRKLHYEPSIRKIDFIKKDILKVLYPVRAAVAVYDTNPSITDPYNTSLVHAGVLLVKKKITVETFIDFAIYMQQYNLPKGKGTYYKVWNDKKEVYVRCLDISTAKKLIRKQPYCTIEQFLKKEIPDCFVEVIE